MRHTIILLLFTTFLTSCAFSKKRTRTFYEEAKEKAPYDAIIVPGVPHDGTSWQSLMRYRVLWSKYLFEHGMTNNIIYSGGAVYTEYCEAKIMAEYGKSFGIPAANIYVDTLAEHSTENVYYSYRLAKKQGFKKIALATDPFQARQLKAMIRKIELPIDFLPVDLDTISNSNIAQPTINVDVTRKKNFVSIKERESFFSRLKGTFGKQILFYEEDLPNEKMIKKFRRQGRLMETEENPQLEQ